MRRNLGFFLAFMLGVGLASAIAQKWEDATVVDPDVHQVVFENDHVRVLEARAPEGWKSSMHSHPPLLAVSVGSARVKFTLPDGSNSFQDFRPGQVLWVDGAEHSWEMMAGNLHIIAVEVKSAQKAASK